MQIISGYVTDQDKIQLSDPIKAESIGLLGAEGHLQKSEHGEEQVYIRCTFIIGTKDKGQVFHVLISAQTEEEERAFIVSPVNVDKYDQKSIDFLEGIIEETSKNGNAPGFSDLRYRKTEDQKYPFEFSVYILPENPPESQGDGTIPVSDILEVPIMLTMGQYLQMSAYFLQVKLGNWMVPMYFNHPMFNRVNIIEVTSLMLNETTIIKGINRTISSFTAYCKSVMFPTKRFCIYTGPVLNRLFKRITKDDQEFLEKNKDVPAINGPSMISGDPKADKNIYLIIDEYEDHCNVLKISADIVKRTNFLDWEKMIYM